MTWAAALSAAEASTFANYGDWRLPNIKELRGLVEECRFSPSINDTIFPSTSNSSTWSASPHVVYGDRAWLVLFNDGNASYDSRTAVKAVRLVRGGQSFGGFVNGQCGSANGVASVSAPSGPALCTSGSAGAVTGSSGGWAWTCLGVNGGTPATCSAPLLDVTPPVLSAISVTTSTLTATSNEAATGYWIALATGTAAPTAAQVKTYAINGAAGVLARGTGAMTANTPKTFTVTGLNANTVYDFYIVAEDAAGNLSLRGSARNAVDAACTSSTVATVQLVDLSNKMTEDFARAFADGVLRSTFNVTCANGRFGVVRLPNVVNGVVGGNAYALVQSSCATKSVQKNAQPMVTAATVSGVWAIRTNQTAMLVDAMFGPLARWVCD